jgi:hypothetical protein
MALDEHARALDVFRVDLSAQQPRGVRTTASELRSSCEMIAISLPR